MKKKQHLLFFICYTRQVFTLRIYMFVTSAYLPGSVLLFLAKRKQSLNSVVININFSILLNWKAFVYMQLSHGF